MTTIKIIRDINAHKENDVINTTPGAAEFLVNAGYAEHVEAENKPRRKAPKPADDETLGDDSD